MSMSCLVLINCCSTTQYYVLQRVPAAMAMCSSTFCPRYHPLISYPSAPFNLKRFSSHISNSTASSSSQPQVIETPARVGFLGIGIMGSPMAHNLLKAGIDLTVWNRTKSKCDPLISLGAKYKSSPEEVAASCDVTFAMLADPQKS